MKATIITCVQCEIPFAFNAEEQRRYLASGFDKPKRCPECRKNKSRVPPMNLRRKDKGKKNWFYQNDDGEFS